MSGQMWTCNLCKGEGKEFMVPPDEIGKALMEAHLADEHGILDYMLPGGTYYERR